MNEAKQYVRDFMDKGMLGENEYSSSANLTVEQLRYVLTHFGVKEVLVAVKLTPDQEGLIRQARAAALRMFENYGESDLQTETTAFLFFNKRQQQLLIG